MSKPKSFLKCWLLVSWLPLVGAILGIVIESIRIAARPLPYISVAKLMAERPTPSSTWGAISDPYADFCGTLIETLESSELRKRAMEQQRSKSLVTLAEDVARREKQLAGKLEKLTNFEKANNIALLTGELSRLTQLTLRLRGKRDEISRRARDSLGAAESDAQLASIERDLAKVEKEIERLNASVAVHDGLSKDYQESKRGYDEILALVSRFQLDERALHPSVSVSERASDAVLDFHKWLRATLLGASAGLILSRYFAEVLYIASSGSAKPTAQRDPAPASA